MSEVPMVEQEVARIQPKIEQKPAITGSDFIKSADATSLSRLKNLVSEKSRKVLELSTKAAKKGAKEITLTGAAFSILISSGCGNVEKQNVPPPSEPPPAVEQLPTGMPSATLEFTEKPMSPIPGSSEVQSSISEAFSQEEESYRSPLFDVWRERGELELAKSVDIGGRKVDFWINSGEYSSTNYFTENSIDVKDYLKRVQGVFNEAIPYSERTTGVSLPEYNVVITHGLIHGSYSQSLRGTNAIAIDAESWNKGMRDKKMYIPRLSAAHEVFHALNYEKDPNESKFGREFSAILHEAGFIANTLGKESLRSDLDRYKNFIRKNNVDISDLTRPAVTRTLAYDTALRVLNEKEVSLEEFNRELLLDPDNGIKSFNKIARKVGLGFTFEELLKSYGVDLVLFNESLKQRRPTPEASSSLTESEQTIAPIDKAEFEKFEPSTSVVDVKTFSPEEWENYFKRVLADKYVSRDQLIKEFGEDYESKLPEVAGKYPGVFVRRGFTKIYENHGDKVGDVMEKTWKYAKLESAQEPEVTPLQDIIDESSIEYGIEDELGNKGFSITFDEKKIIDLLKNDPNKVINFSFQVGDVGVFLEQKRIVAPKPTLDLGPGFYDKEGNYKTITIPHSVNFEILVENEEEARKRLDSDYGKRVLVPNGVAFYKKEGIKDTGIIGYVERGGDTLVTPRTTPKEEIIEQWEQAKEETQRNSKVEDVESPSLKIVGAYDGTKADENVRKLFEVAKAYPDKFFVAAGGNNGEDILKTLEKLSDERPSNLIIVGEWMMERGRPRHEMYGADIYVDNNYLEIHEGSSFSTPVITAYAAALFEKGLSMEEVVETIKSTTLEEKYRWEGAKAPHVNVFNPKGALAKIKSLTAAQR